MTTDLLSAFLFSFIRLLLLTWKWIGSLSNIETSIKRRTQRYAIRAHDPLKTSVKGIQGKMTSSIFCSLSSHFGFVDATNYSCKNDEPERWTITTTTIRERSMDKIMQSLSLRMICTFTRFLLNTGRSATPRGLWFLLAFFFCFSSEATSSPFAFASSSFSSRSFNKCFSLSLRRFRSTSPILAYCFCVSEGGSNTIDVLFAYSRAPPWT